MPSRFIRTIVVASFAALLSACGASEAPDAAGEAAPGASPATGSGASAASSPSAGGGTARISLTGDDVSVTGDYPARLCGGAYIMGEGVSFQAQAGEWQITIASERREAGEVALNEPDGGVNVVVTANGPGRQFVRGAANGGTLVIEEDFSGATADLELRSLAGGAPARLAATFTCAAAI